MVVTGVTLAGLGTTAIPVGALFAVAFSTQSHTNLTCLQPCTIRPQGPSAGVVAGEIMVGAGAAAILASIPMIVIGVHRVPVGIAPSGPLGSAGMTLKVSF